MRFYLKWFLIMFLAFTLPIDLLVLSAYCFPQYFVVSDPLGFFYFSNLLGFVISIVVLPIIRRSYKVAERFYDQGQLSYIINDIRKGRIFFIVKWLLIVYLGLLILICIVPLVSTLWLGSESLNSAVIYRFLPVVLYMPLQIASLFTLVFGNAIYEAYHNLSKNEP